MPRPEPGPGDVLVDRGARGRQLGELPLVQVVDGEDDIELVEQFRPGLPGEVRVGQQIVLGAQGAQAEKLEPQPQVVVALGFLITNCAPCRSSL